MKKFIQISVLFLAILIGASWAVFRPAIHGFLRLPESYVASESERLQETNVAEMASSQKAVVKGAVTTENTEAPPTKKTEVADNKLPPKVELSKVNPEPVIAPDSKVASTIPDPATPPSNSVDAMKDQEAEIQRIVMKRYPDIPKIPFSEKYSDLSKLPRDVFPERIQIRQELNFELIQEGKVVGVSFVKADGFVRPWRIEGDEIIASSLSNNEMRTTLPLAETDFAAAVEANYDAVLERAILRIEKMRDADRAEIRKNPTLYQKLIAEGEVWHDADDQQFDQVKISAEQLLAGSPFKPLAFYLNGLVMVEEEGPYTGGFVVVIVLLEGMDSGFGPFRWRAKCLFRDGQIIGWLGMPKIPSNTNS